VYKLKLLKIRFDLPLRHHELPLFRGAIIAKVGQEHILFHNHITTGYRNNYPLIQYKIIEDKASILCLGEGVDTIDHFLQQQNWNILLGKRPKLMCIEEMKLKEYNLQVRQHCFRYQIRNWIAINKDVYKRYQSYDHAEKQVYMNKTLVCNMVALTQKRICERIEAKILRIDSEHFVRIKKVMLKAFDLEFESNLFIPNDLGLGGKVSLGFGIVRQLHKQL
jgi:Cas6b N-terminal domain/Cas6b C-terminal domain